MPSPRRIEILPDAERVEEALVAAAQASRFVDGARFLTFGELIDRLGGARRWKRRPISALTARIVVWSCAQRLGAGPFGDFVHQPAFARAALELVFDLKAGRLAVSEFAEAVETLSEARRGRAQYLARLYGAYEERLAELRLADREDLVRGAIERLDAEGAPPFFRDCDEIAVRHVHDFSPLRLELIRALASQCERASIRFVLEVPGAGTASVDAAVDGAMGLFERAFISASHVESMKTDFIELRRPLAQLGPRLFSNVAGPEEPAPVELFQAATPTEECRHLARQAAGWVEKGIAPEQVAVAFRDLGDEAERVVEALGELGVPARVRRGPPLTSTAAGRLAIELPLLVDDGFPVDRVTWFLTSRYAPEISTHVPTSHAALFARASIRDDRVGARDGRGAYEVRLSELAERLNRLARRGSDSQTKDVLSLLEHCRRLFGICTRIPEQGTALELLQSWWQSLEAIGFHRAVRTTEPRVAEGTSLGRAVLTALGRDQAAAEALKNMAAELEAALRQSGAASWVMNRRTFQRWLVDAAEDFNLPARGPRGGAVRVVDLRELAGTSFEHVCIGALADGRLPSRDVPSALLPDEDRRSVNIHFRRDVFRLTTGEFDGRAPWKLAEDRLLFFVGLASARSTATLSYARTSFSGQEQTASPFLEEIQRLTGGRLQVTPFQTLPLLREVMTESELRSRVALEALARADVRTSEPDPLGPSLKQKFASEAWFKFAQEQTRIEEERLFFFSNDRVVGSYSGRVSGDVQGEIQQLFAFDSQHPLSATTTRTFGNCAFQGFLDYALCLDAPEEPAEDLDARGKGSFWHCVLETLFPILKARGLLNLPVSQIPDSVIDEALEEAARQTRETIHVGHPSLWRISRARARLMVERILNSELHGLPFEGHQPTYTELSFGKRDSPEGWRTVIVPHPDGGPAIHVQGKIDRLDATGDSLGVIDYKSGKPPPWQDLLVTDFQLPLYLFAARASGFPRAAKAAWLNMKDGELTTLEPLVVEKGRQPLDTLLSTNPIVQREVEEAGQKNLPVALHRLVGGLRAGKFPARPVDCTYCCYRAVCRISQRALEEET